MAANLGQAFLGGAGIVPNLAQELAGNFESRESFHDYIYSKLLLGEQVQGAVDNKSGNNVGVATSGGLVVSNQSTVASTVSGVNSTVFPSNSSNLAANFQNTLAQQPTSSSASGGGQTIVFQNQQQQQQQQAGVYPTHMVFNAGGVVFNLNNAAANSIMSSNNQANNLIMAQNINPGHTSGGGGFITPSSQDHTAVAGTTTPVPQPPATPTPAPLALTTPTIPAKKKKAANQSQQNNTQLPIPGEQLVDGEQKVKKKSHHKPKKEKTNICEVCGRGFAEKYTLNRHMMTHTHVKPYQCTKCNMAFSRSDGLAKHMAAGHRRVDAHHCDVCGGTFNSETSFEQHRREYGNTLPFVCNLCMLAFSQCCHLNYHMKSHNLSKIHEGFGADGVDHRTEDIETAELIPDDFSPPKKDEKKNGDLTFPFLDPNIVIKPEIVEGMANASFAAGFDALTGIGTTPASSSSASNLPPISEEEMKKYFDIKIPDPKFLAQRPHKEGNPDGPAPESLFCCEVCGKGFTRKYHMQRHERMHRRGPVPRAHLLDWTRRPYACGVCKMGFTRQHHLTRHMLIHTGERPHECHVCGKAFRRFTNLTLHVRTVHGAERPFKCHICGRGFPRLYSLQRHLRLHALKAAGLHPSTMGLTGAALAAAACAPTSSPASMKALKNANNVNVNMNNQTSPSASVNAAGVLLHKAKKSSKKKKKNKAILAAAAEAAGVTLEDARMSVVDGSGTGILQASTQASGSILNNSLQAGMVLPTLVAPGHHNSASLDHQQQQIRPDGLVEINPNTSNSNGIGMNNPTAPVVKKKKKKKQKQQQQLLLQQQQEQQEQLQQQQQQQLQQQQEQLQQQLQLQLQEQQQQQQQQSQPNILQQPQQQNVQLQLQEQQQQQNLLQQQLQQIQQQQQAQQLQQPSRPASHFDPNQQLPQQQQQQTIQTNNGNNQLRFIQNNQGIITAAGHRGIIDQFTLAQAAQAQHRATPDIAGVGTTTSAAFVIQQQQQQQRANLVQSPHPHHQQQQQIINVIESRPGSRNMVTTTQLAGVDNNIATTNATTIPAGHVTVGNFHGGFFVPQQLASIDLSSAAAVAAAQGRGVPFQIQQNGQVITFTPSAAAGGAATHQIVAATPGDQNQAQQQGLPSYSLNTLPTLNQSVVNSLQFQAVTGVSAAQAALYQQQLGESLRNITDIQQLQQVTGLQHVQQQQPQANNVVTSLGNSIQY